MKTVCVSSIILLLFCTSFSPKKISTYNVFRDTILYPEETHFKNVQQLTFGGDNAEAYWSFDGKSIVFQRTSVKDGIACDQIFMGKVPQKKRTL